MLSASGSKIELVGADSAAPAPTGRNGSTITLRFSAEMNRVNMISTRSTSPERKRAIRSWVRVRANSRLASVGSGVCAASTGYLRRRK